MHTQTLRPPVFCLLFALSGEHSSRFVREFFDVTHNMSSMFTALSRRAMYTRFGRAMVRRVRREYSTDVPILPSPVPQSTTSCSHVQEPLSLSPAISGSIFSSVLATRPHRSPVLTSDRSLRSSSRLVHADHLAALRQHDRDWHDHDQNQPGARAQRSRKTTVRRPGLRQRTVDLKAPLGTTAKINMLGASASGVFVRAPAPLPPPSQSSSSSAPAEPSSASQPQFIELNDCILTAGHIRDFALRKPNMQPMDVLTCPACGCHARLHAQSVEKTETEKVQAYRVPTVDEHPLFENELIPKMHIPVDFWVELERFLHMRRTPRSLWESVLIMSLRKHRQLIELTDWIRSMEDRQCEWTEIRDQFFRRFNGENQLESLALQLQHFKQAHRTPMTYLTQYRTMLTRLGRSVPYDRLQMMNITNGFTAEVKKELAHLGQIKQQQLSLATGEHVPLYRYLDIDVLTFDIEHMAPSVYERANSNKSPSASPRDASTASVDRNPREHKRKRSTHPPTAPVSAQTAATCGTAHADATTTTTSKKRSQSHKQTQGDHSRRKGENGRTAAVDSASHKTKSTPATSTPNPAREFKLKVRPPAQHQSSRQGSDRDLKHTAHGPVVMNHPTRSSSNGATVHPCALCLSTAHFTRNCQSGNTVPLTPCRFCNKTGHWQRDCPNPTTPARTYSIGAANMRGLDRAHIFGVTEGRSFFLIESPQLPGRVLRAVLSDTGATFTAFSEALVSEFGCEVHKPTGACKYLEFADGATTLRLGKVDLQLQLHFPASKREVLSFDMRVEVMPCAYDIILGVEALRLIFPNDEIMSYAPPASSIADPPRNVKYMPYDTTIESRYNESLRAPTAHIDIARQVFLQHPSCYATRPGKAAPILSTAVASSPHEDDARRPN